MKSIKPVMGAFSLMLMLVNVANALPKEKKDADLWLTNFAEAVNKSSAQHKLIFMSFSGSDWCKPCIKLTKEVLDSDDFKNYAKENFILLRLDFPRHKNTISQEQVKHNEKLADKYNREGAFPLILILDSKENVIAKTGYRPGGPQKYIEHLKSLVTKNHKNGS
ncbi:MAG: thioredoxin family protein [Desulfobacterales bacterium]